jgi:phosphoribosyl-ATP pyrophosphohydrolase
MATTNQSPPSHTLDRLAALIAERKQAPPHGSYTAELFSAGRARIAQKVGEEGVETVIAAMKDDRAELASESADLLYHLLVLWADADLPAGEVWTMLEARLKG